jgi:tol-pal system protein YbgF
MVLATMVVGCARSAAPGGTTPVAQEERERIAALEQETRRRAEEVRELESQLALARARAAAPRTETVRIGDSTTPEPREDGFVFFEDEGTSWDEPPAEVLEGEGENEEAQEEASGPRPVLRLHEEPAFEMPEGLPALEPAPLPSNGTLPARVAAGGWRTLDPQPVSAPPPSPPTASLPFPTTVAPAPSFAAPNTLPHSSLPQSAAPRVDPSTEAYGRALGLLRERRVTEALRAFDTFLADHGGSSLAPAARYWRAEALYVLRRYGEAQAAFDAYLVAHPRDTRAADALLKLGLCHEHMGDRSAAQRIYERLRREHPSSVAARLASREDA